MTDLIRKSTSSLLQLSAGLVQCTGWLALICLLKAERDLEKRLDKLLAGFEIPPKVEYSLTERGHSLMKVLDQLCTWGNDNRIDHE